MGARNVCRRSSAKWRGMRMGIGRILLFHADEIYTLVHYTQAASSTASTSSMYTGRGVRDRALEGDTGGASWVLCQQDQDRQEILAPVEEQQDKDATAEDGGGQVEA